MTATFEKTGVNTVVLTFEISEDKIKEGLDKAFKKVQPSLNVPGFRKGKVPRAIFNRQFGEEALYQDALNILLPDAYDNAVEETGIYPVTQPKIDIKSLEKGQAWVITAEVIVKPEVKLGEYKGLTVAKQDRTVSDEDVQKELEKEQNKLAELSVKDGEAVLGDTVVIDYEGFKDGEAFAGGKGENHSLELGSNSFIPGFEEQLVGTKAGEEKDLNLTFPEAYHAEELKGQAVVFKVTVKEVKSKEVPQLDDEFAKDVDESVSTLDELKAKIKERLVTAKENQAKALVEEEAIKQAVANAEIVELPHEMVHNEVHRQMDFYLNDMKRQGISEELYYQLTGTTRDDLHKQMEVGAEDSVKTQLVLEAIAKAENFEVSDADVEKEIAELAATYNMEVSAVANVLNVDMLQQDIKMKKAMAIVVDTAVEA